MKQVEQSRGGFDRVAAVAERCVALDVAKPDQKLVIASIDGVEAQRLERRVVAGELAWGFNFAAVDFDRLRNIDRTAAKKTKQAVGGRDDSRFDATLCRTRIDDEGDAAVQ